MKRNPRKLAWTKSFRRAHGKEMTVDSTLAFAQRRNIPVRYNRDLVQTTLKAMSRITEIRSRRERAFYKARMRGNSSCGGTVDAGGSTAGRGSVTSACDAASHCSSSRAVSWAADLTTSRFP